MSEDNNMERIRQYIERHDPLNKAVDRSEVMAYYLNQRIVNPISSFSRTIRHIDDKLNHHMDLGSDKYP